jgi:hypothetical protein
MPHAAPADLTVEVVAALARDARYIPLSDIKVRRDDRMRSLQPEVVDRIAKSFAEVGQVQPIVIVADGVDTGFLLVAGWHRFEAALKLGWDSILALVVEGLDADRLKLIEIDENLARGELSPIERARLHAKRKEIYLRLNPETRHGGDRRSKSHGEILKKPSYAKAAAAATGCSPATVSREVRRGEAIKSIPDIDALKGTSLDQEGELDALAKLPTDQQASLTAKAKASEEVSAKPSKAVRAEREAKRQERHKKKLEERQAQERAPSEEEQEAREERAFSAVAYLLDRLSEEQLVQFQTLIDGNLDVFGEVLQAVTEKLLEERDAAHASSDGGEQAQPLSQKDAGRVASSGIANGPDPSPTATTGGADAAEVPRIGTDPGVSTPEPDAQDGPREIATVDSEEGAGHVAA